ncbi:MAG: hypothetical protein HKO93_00565 [Flavobacteriales bacterium]|nr:hypothetical protein [Flavobacteriales bacterium]
MKLTHTLIVLVSIIISIASATGVAEEQNRDRTGSPDGSTTCTACHTGGGYNPTLNIILENNLGEIVTSYIPGEDYTLKFNISSIPFPTVYGFQATALFNDLSDAGNFSNPGAGVQLEEVNTVEIPSRHIVEHSNPGFIGNYQVQWTAPMSEDDITIYASAVTANGNDEPEGDKATSSTLVISSLDPIGIVDLLKEDFKLITTSTEWRIVTPIDRVIERVSVLTTNGRLIAYHENKNILDHSGFSPGIYFIVAEAANQLKTFKVLLL